MDAQENVLLEHPSMDYLQPLRWFLTVEVVGYDIGE
jgi:hypothetical protein